MKDRLRIGYGPTKTELTLPSGYDRQSFSYPLDDPAVLAPHVMEGFHACLGVPRHHLDNPVVITKALQDMGVNHDRLLYLIEEI